MGVAVADVGLDSLLGAADGVDGGAGAFAGHGGSA